MAKITENIRQGIGSQLGSAIIGAVIGGIIALFGVYFASLLADGDRLEEQKQRLYDKIIAQYSNATIVPIEYKKTGGLSWHSMQTREVEASSLGEDKLVGLLDEFYREGLPYANGSIQKTSAFYNAYSPIGIYIREHRVGKRGKDDSAKGLKH